jgi:acyl-CoA synthetase (AMP-forming)/AMP-acid ligase II
MRKEAGSLVRLAAEWYGDATAFVYRDRSMSFRDINRRANLLGSGLLARGLSHGDRVGVLAFNTLEVVECWFGMEKHNLVRAVLHTHFPIEVHAGSLREIGARALVFDAALAEQVASIREQISGVALFVCIGPSDRCPVWATPYEAIIAAGTDAEPRIQLDEDTPVHIQYTSGTTGVPKPWVMTNRSWQFVIETNYSHFNTAIEQSLSRDDVNMHFHPLQWASGFQTLYPYFIHGCKSVLVDDREFIPDEVLRTIEAHRVSGTFIPGPHLIQLLDCPTLSAYDYSSLRRVVLFFVNTDLIDRARRVFGECMISGFGSTEQGAVTARLTPREYRQFLATDPRRCEAMGRPASPFVEIRIVDNEGREVAPGELGEIVVRSPMSTSSYWERPDLTRDAFLPDDWFRPGDIGWMDPEGYLYYGDRAKDRIQSAGGDIVYPHAVESVLLQHGSVANAGVVGIPDGDGEKVVACILVKSPDVRTDQVIEELVVACRDQLRPAEVPERIVFVDDLPTVLGGAKVQRSELRARLIAAGGMMPQASAPRTGG